ncbi:MAG: hypothetical protein GY774_02385 [Planctomycetes bacterium]|nr:hypothetical protein [Planctomycetota bacterium]
MSKKLIYLVSFVLVLSLTLMGTARAELVAWWRFDEGSGTQALDSSGYGNDGVVEGDAKWVAGQIGGAIEFNGQNSRVVAPFIPLDSRSFTITMWVNPDLVSSEQVIFSQRDEIRPVKYLGFCRLLYLLVSGTPTRCKVDGDYIQITNGQQNISTRLYKRIPPPLSISSIS